MALWPIAETLGFAIEQTQQLKTLCVFIRCLEGEAKGSYSSCTHGLFGIDFFNSFLVCFKKKHSFLGLL